MARKRLLVPVIFLLLAASPFRAWATDHGQTVAVTFSPLHAAFNSTAEITAEYAVKRKLGVALIGGYGRPSFEDINGNDVQLTVIEAGASARYYLFGSFDHGMQVGGEVLYINVSGETDDVNATASGISVGPFIGYKKAARFGLTFDAQLGVAYLAVRAKSTNSSTGDEGEAEADGTGILLNLNLGWSF